MRPKPRLFNGFRDIFCEDFLARRKLIEAVRIVYERYGFIPLETSSVEFVDVLGKFLPESTTPQGGIFPFRNPDLDSKKTDHPDSWLALRYDLTAPLARVVAQYKDLHRPFRRYQLGMVWRHEKPGPGRFREFCQFDFDSVGTKSMAADAEICSVICDVFETLGFKTGDYAVKVNNRKIMQGILEICGLSETNLEEESSQAIIVLRAIDKLDRVGMEGVIDLLGKGRKDRSGDFTEGAGLEKKQIEKVEEYLTAKSQKRKDVIKSLSKLVEGSKIGEEGIGELQEIDQFLQELGFDDNQVEFDPTIVRGLSYYTGPVMEGVLLKEIVDAKGRIRSFGSVFGGGRYDSLVERFTGQKIAATGGSVGIDRLLEAVKLLDAKPARRCTSDVLVTVMDKKRMADYLKIAQEIRNAGINAEVFLGKGNIGKQMKYADKLGIPIALIAGSDEFEKGEYQLKDLNLGMEMSEQISDREQWRKDRPAQQAIKKAELIAKIQEILQDS